MIIHLPNTIPSSQIQVLAEQLEALCINKESYYVLVTSHMVHSLPSEIADMALAVWDMPTDMQLSSRSYQAETHRIAIGDTSRTDRTILSDAQKTGYPCIACR